MASLSETLQYETKEYSAAMKNVKSVLADFTAIRNSLDGTESSFGIWWDKTTTYLKDYAVTPLCLNDLPSCEPKADYSNSIAKPILDSIIDSMKSRFNMQSRVLERLGELLPRSAAATTLRAADFDIVLKTYQRDIPNLRDFSTQYTEWQAHWAVRPVIDIPDGIVATLSEMTEDMKSHFGIIYTLLRIYAVVPVSTASGERSFSAMKLLKTRLRTSMSQPRLNAVALIYDAVYWPIDAEKIARMLLRDSRRRWRKNGNTGTSYVEDLEDQTDAAPEVTQDDSGIFDADAGCFNALPE
jgi:hypothetical protein